MSSVASFNPSKILVVENDIGRRSIMESLIKTFGYVPVIAEDALAGMASNKEDRINRLIRDAIDKCVTERCHIAIIHKRLRGPLNPDDTSGITLGEDLLKKTDAKVVLTTAEQNGNEIANLQKQGLDFVIRGDSKNPFHDLIEKKLSELLKNRSASARENFAIDLEPDDLFSELAQKFNVSSEDFFDILTQLYPLGEEENDQPLRICQLVKRSDSSTVMPRNSLTCAVSRDHRVPEVLKFARRSRILRERENYKKFIDGRIRDHAAFAPLAIDRVSFFYKIGAAPYLDVSIDAKTFSQIYRDYRVNEDVLLEAIDAYKNRWSWYDADKQHGNAEPGESLLEIYSKVWFDESSYDSKQNNPMDQLKKRLETAIKGLNDSIYYSHPTLEFLNKTNLHHPVVWVKNKLDQKNSLLGTGALKQVTHGDLWGENIFVKTMTRQDTSGHIEITQFNSTILIDFERTGYGYLLQDFVQLEFDVITRLIEIESDLTAWQDLFCFYTSLISPERMGELIPKKSFSNENSLALSKAFAIVRGIRKNAKDIVGEAYKTEHYLLGLLYNAVFRATLEKPNIDKVSSEFAASWELERERALLLGALIIEKIRHPAKPFPPAKWNDVCSPYSLYEAIKVELRAHPLDENNLRLVADDLNLDYENLAGNTPSNKTISLLKKFYEKESDMDHKELSLDDLLHKIREVRPGFLAKRK